MNVKNNLEAVQSIWGFEAASDTILNKVIGQYFLNLNPRKPKNGNAKDDKEQENKEGGGDETGGNSEQFVGDPRNNAIAVTGGRDSV